MIFIALGAAVSIALLGMAGITLSNLLLFPRLRPRGSAILRPPCRAAAYGCQEIPGLVMLSGSTGQFPLRQGISETSRAREFPGSATQRSEEPPALLHETQLPASSFQSPTSNLPFISILIPARNEAAVIGETVRRLLAQTYPRFELLVLDDGSTDGTAGIARAAAGGDDGCA